MSQTSRHSSEGDTEMSAIEYARHTGIACHYLSDSTLNDHLYRLRQNLPGRLHDDSGLPSFDLGAQVTTDERLEFSRDAALLLSTVSCVEGPDVFSPMVTSMLESTGIKRLKLEIPLLKSDHELDCQDFIRRETFEIQLQDIKLPTEVLDEERFEGTRWPSRISTLGDEITRDLQKEKLAVHKDTLIYIQDTIKQAWTMEDKDKLWSSEQQYRKNTALELLTPPLSPMRFSLRQFEPDFPSSGFDVPLFSDPPCMIENELSIIEDQIMELDLPTPIRNTYAMKFTGSTSSDPYLGDDSMKLGEIFSPLASIDLENTPPSADTKRFARENLKVECILTPVGPVATPPKSVRFSELMKEAGSVPFTPLPVEDVESTFFNEAFGEAYEKATQLSEREKLIEADATSRVTVPELSFKKPDAPWKAYVEAKNATALLRLQQSLIRETVGIEAQPWPGARMGETSLRWQPFGHDVSKVALEDTLDLGDESWRFYMTDTSSEDEHVQANETWQLADLQILRVEDEDEDDLEPGMFLKDQQEDLRSLVKKRKIMLEDGRSRTSDTERKEEGARFNNANSRTIPVAKNKIDKSMEQNIGSWLDGDFSTRKELDKYMEIRGVKKPKLMDDALPIKSIEPHTSIQEPQEKFLLSSDLTFRKSPSIVSEPLPVPTFTVPTTPIHIIMSTTMSRKRDIVRTLESTIPTLTIIERNFSAHNTTAWQRGSVSRSPVASPLSAEADIIISPCLGVIITTLQKIKQKPLPGQKVKPEIRDRLEKVSLRYEQLVVLISEARALGAGETTRGLDKHDCLAFAEFVGFTAGLDCNINVQFIGGGNDILCQWLMRLILQPRVAEELLVDETHWEVFLRRAGMNAFAAQSVIAMLKAPDGVDATSSSKGGQYGLSSLVEMGEQERIARFQHICGMKLLKRVSAVIDSNWHLR